MFELFTAPHDEKVNYRVREGGGRNARYFHCPHAEKMNYRVREGEEVETVFNLCLLVCGVNCLRVGHIVVNVVWCAQSVKLSCTNITEFFLHC